MIDIIEPMVVWMSDNRMSRVAQMAHNLVTYLPTLFIVTQDICLNTSLHKSEQNNCL